MSTREQLETLVARAVTLLNADWGVRHLSMRLGVSNVGYRVLVDRGAATETSVYREGDGNYHAIDSAELCCKYGTIRAQCDSRPVSNAEREAVDAEGEPSTWVATTIGGEA